MGNVEQTLGFSSAGMVRMWLLYCRMFHFFYLDNLVTVDEGRVYRSGQMSNEGLRATAVRLHLASVLNLRGANSDAVWYRNELETTQSLHLVHYDIRMGAREFPSPEVLKQLTDIFARGPYPMLIHCNRGADRSGLASALYLIQCRGESPEIASGQLALIWGHVPLCGYDRMDEFLTFYGQTRQGKDLVSWTESDYPKLFESRVMPQ